MLTYCIWYRFTYFKQTEPMSGVNKILWYILRQLVMVAKRFCLSQIGQLMPSNKHYLMLF